MGHSQLAVNDYIAGAAHIAGLQSLEGAGIRIETIKKDQVKFIAFLDFAVIQPIAVRYITAGHGDKDRGMHILIGVT